MQHNLGTNFFLTLAETLMGSQVNTAAILSSLELICREFAFDGGRIYDVDYSNHFCLMENYNPSEITFTPRFSADRLAPQDQEYLALQEITWITKNGGNSALELYLLKIHQAAALILLPITDANHQIYGLAVLSNATPMEPLNDAGFHLLSGALFMLAHYVEKRMFQQRIQQSQVTLGSILDNTGIDIYVNDFNNHDILYVNKSMAAPYGGQAEFTGRKCWEVLFPGQKGPCEFCPQTKLTDEQGNPTKVYSWDYQRAFDGSWFRVFSAAFHWADGRLAHVVSSADITDNKRNEALIERLANYDQLTGLPNRRMLLAKCQQRIENATENQRGYLMFFDIDGFKSVNDNFGHDAGDEFLIQLGEFFSNIPLLKDSVYRNGGDEFVAILGGEAVSKANIMNLGNFILKRFQSPWKLKYGDVFCGTSIGIACYPEDGQTTDTLLQTADKAMYQVKKSGGNGICFGYQLSDATGKS